MMHSMAKTARHHAQSVFADVSFRETKLEFIGRSNTCGHSMPKAICTLSGSGPSNSS